MEIRGFLENSFIDYPGKLSCVIFTYGCNLRCSWCHSPSLVTESKFKLKKYNLDKIIKFIKEKNKNKKWIDAVVVCGGEPTIQKDLINSLKQIRKELPDIMIKLDTNGTNPIVLNDIIKNDLVDYIAMDVKLGQLNSDKYRNSIGLVKSFKDYEFRMTCCPSEINDENVKQINMFFGAKLFVFQNFNNRNKMIDSKYKKIIPYKEEKLIEWARMSKDWFDKVLIR